MPVAPYHLQRLTLVRHGETRGQSSIRYWGATDMELDALGESQMQRVGDALCGEHFDAVLTSTKQRTVRAAELIVPHLVAIPVVGFNEISFGCWEGLTREEIARVDPAGYQNWQDRVPDFIFPGAGDSVQRFRARVAETFHWLLPALPQSTLLIVHRGIITTIVSELLGLDDQGRATYPIALGSIHVLLRNDDGWQVDVTNRTDHLAGLQP